MSAIPFWKKVCKKWKFILEIQRQRRELLRLDDRMLKDIGISRIDAEREAKRPFWDNSGVKDATLRKRNPPQAFREADREKFNPCTDSYGSTSKGSAGFRCYDSAR